MGSSRSAGPDGAASSRADHPSSGSSGQAGPVDPPLGRAAPVSVRPLSVGDASTAVRLHLDVLGAEFISRLGPPFLRAYYRAWIEAEDALALAATGPTGTIDGILLGAVDPSAHTAAMVRRHWPSLVAHLVVAAARDPRLARDLLVTRAVRYVQGIARVARRSRRHLPAPTPTPSVDVAAGGTGEITHLLVAPSAQGRGIGRALVTAAEDAARCAGLRELVLVTPVEEWGARRFYERIGWQVDGEVVSRSGERFVHFCRPLTAP